MKLATALFAVIVAFSMSACTTTSAKKDECCASGGSCETKPAAHGKAKKY